MADKKKPLYSEEHAKEFLHYWNNLDSPEIQKVLQDKGITTDQAKEVLRNVQKQELENYSLPEEKSSLLSHVLNVLDYGAGVVRTPSMMAAAALSGPRGREAVAKNWRQDLSDAFTPNDGRPAPSTGEWLTRMGIQKGRDLNTKLLQVPWDMLMSPKQMLTGGKTPPAPGPDLYDAITTVGDAGLSPGGLGLVGKGAKTLGATRYGLGERLGRILKGQGTFPNQDLYNMTAAGAEKAIEAAANPGIMKKTVVPALKFAADPLAFAAPRLGESMYKGVFAEPDRLSKAAGFGPVSPLLAEEGIWGAPGTAYDESQKLGKDLAAKMKNFRSVVNDATHEMQATDEMGYNFDRSRKSLREPMKEFFANATPEYGQDAVDAAKDAVWEHWDQTMPKKTLNMEDMHRVKQGFQGMAREANAFKERPRTTTGNPKEVGEGRTVELTGDAYREQAKIARKAEEAAYDAFSQKFNADHGIDTASAGSLLHLNNRKIGALMAAEPGLLQRYRFSPTQQSFGGPAAQWFKDYILNPSDAVRSGLGLLGSRYGQPAGMLLRGAAVGRYAPDYRSENPWKLMDINVKGTGDTSYDH